MNQFVDEISAKVGIALPVAYKAIGIILDFLRNEGDETKIAQLLQAMPEAREILDDYSAQNPGNGGGLLGSLGGMMGSAGGLMATANQLMSAGLSMGEVQQVTKEVISYARQQAGEECVNDIINSIPGLSQFA